MHFKGTKDKGLILKPKLTSDTFNLDVHVDAVFASGDLTELATNSDRVKF